MLPGFLPVARPSTFMLDVVVLAMIAVLPVLTWSIYLVKVRRNYQLHKRVQIGLGLTLLVAVVLFEVDMRYVGGWKVLAKESPYFGGWLDRELYVHLFFSVTTTLLWIVTMMQALRRFPNPPMPGEYSAKHRRLAKLSAAFMYATAITGWTFYYMAFMAR